MLDSNNPKSVYQFFQDVKAGVDMEITSLPEQTTLEDLMQKDETGTTYLEYMCKRKINFSFGHIKDEITNNKEALFICVKNNYIDWINNIQNEDILFEPVFDGKNIYEYLYENKIKVPFNFFYSTRNHIELIDCIIKYNINDLWSLSTEMLNKLFIEQDGIYPIDKYINDSKFYEQFKYRISAIDLNTLVNYCIKKQKFDLLTSCSAFQLTYNKIDDKYGFETVFDLLLDNHVDLGNLKSTLQGIDLTHLLDYCQKKQNFELLKYLNEQQYLTTLDNGQTVLEYTLDLGLTPEFYGYDFKDKQVIDTLIKYNRDDLLFNAHADLLVSDYTDGKTYLDYILDEHKKGNNINFDKISFSIHYRNAKTIASELLILANNGLIGYFPSINKDVLLKKTEDKTVIEWLIEMDKDLTLSTILPECRERRDPDFVIVLRGLGIEDTLMDYKTDEKQFTDEYIDSYNKDYASNYSGEHEDLLNELGDLFYNDGKSEKELIDVLITSYKQVLLENEELGLLEIKQLIEIKKNNYEKFTYTKTNTGAYFSSADKGVHLDSSIIDTINHETSHALHYFLADNYIPEDYASIIERVRNNPETITKVAEYSRQFKKIRTELKEAISKSEIATYYDEKYSGENVVELATFLASSKEDKKKIFIKDYPEQVLDTILAGSFTVDEYIAQRKEIEQIEMLDAMLRNNYGAFLAIGDVIDAVFLGKFKNGVLKGEDEAFIESAYGHGIGYFKNTNHGFDEMIAEYGEIMKSKNGQEMILYLRSIVGDELVDAIEECYQQRIIRSDRYISDLKEEKGHER